MAAHSVYSDKELHGKNSSDKQEMLFRKGINWNNYPAGFKRGTYIQKRTVFRKFTTEEIFILPEKHQARFNPELLVERSEWHALELPPLASIGNPDAVIFNGAKPFPREPSHV